MLLAPVIKSSNVEIKELCDLLQNDQPFMLARYNDGEFIAITNWDYIYNCPADKSHGNIDGHKYDLELGKVLRDAILSDENKILSNNKKYIFQSKLEHYKNYHKNKFNLNTGSLNNIKFNISTITSDFTDTVYGNPSLFVNIIDKLNSKNLIIIGPNYLKKFKPLIVKKYIEIPLTDCFRYKDKIIQLITEEINNGEKLCFLFMASMTTNYIIEKMKNQVIDKHFMIDFGSALDNFFSNKTFPQIRRRIYNEQFIKDNYPSHYWVE